MKNRLFAFITTLCLCICCVPAALANSTEELCDIRRQDPLSFYANSGADLSFTDVNPADSYYNSVKYVYENGLFSGTSATTFSPNGTMNRAMLAAVLYRLAGSPTVSGSFGFTDVKYNAYYKDAVVWAIARGIINGTSNTTFAPQDPITHQQMAVLLHRYAVLYLGMDSSGTASLSSYPDGNQVNAYAQKAMQWCISKGLITGSILSPKGNATRAVVATMLYQLSALPQGTGGYKQALESILGGGSEYAQSYSVYYHINGDGTEELLSTYNAAGGNEQRVAVYTLQNGQAIRLFG